MEHVLYTAVWLNLDLYDIFRYFAHIPPHVVKSKSRIPTQIVLQSKLRKRIMLCIGYLLSSFLRPLHSSPKTFGGLNWHHFLSIKWITCKIPACLHWLERLVCVVLCPVVGMSGPCNILLISSVASFICLFHLSCSGIKHSKALYFIYKPIYHK